MRRAILLSVVLLAGCGGDEAAAPTQERERQPEPAAAPHVVRVEKPTAREREYLHTVGEWVLASEGADCERAVAAYAGEPPTERMADLERAAVAACAGRTTVDSVVVRIAGYEFHWGDAQQLPTRGGRTRASRVEPRFSDAVSKLTDGESEVRCWSETDWRAVASAGSPYDEDEQGGAAEIAGFVNSEDGRIHLAPDVCDELVELVYGDVKGADADVAFAVATIAHEARHRMGEQREDRTECWAVQNVRSMASLLGADAELAGELADLYWEEIYPEQEAPYFSEECRDGGELDLRPESDDWP